MNIVNRSGICVIVVLLCAFIEPALAQTDHQDPLAQLIGQLLERITKLEEQVAALEARLARFEGHAEADRPTPQRG